MWHLKTSLGTFWVLEAEAYEEESGQSFLLGIDDCELGRYPSMDGAMLDVLEQSTGHFHWDSLSQVKLPQNSKSWIEGVPDGW